MNSFTLVLLVVAIVIFVRLYRSLGTRNKNYKEQERAYKSATIVSAPRPRAPAQLGARETISVDTKSSDAELQAALQAMQAREPSFNTAQFRARAESAYRYILAAYAKGEHTKLKPLLAPALYKEFRDSILARKKAKHNLRTEILSLSRPDIRKIDLQQNKASIEVAFVCELLSVLTNADGEVLEGDENVAVALHDVWRFARTLGSEDPSWILTKIDSTLQED